MPRTHDYYSKPKEEEVKRDYRAPFKRPLTFFLVIVAIILVMSVFFKVSKIEVTGNNKYSSEKIIQASGIHTGDNLFFLNRIGAGTKVVVKLPYIDSVSITRRLPNVVKIQVEESDAVGCVAVGDELWSVSQNGKFLGKVSSDDAALIARIRGIKVSNAKVGELIAVSKDEQAKLDYLLEIMYQISARSLTDKVSSIDVTDAANPSIEFDDRFVVNFGARDNTEYKFGKLLSAVSQLKADDAGTLDLSDSNKVTFRPN